MGLEPSHLCLIAGGTDPECARLRAALPDAVAVADRGELEALLGRMLAGPELRPAGRPAARTLDLVGYATADKLLAIGGWVIDADDRAVLAFFRELAEHDVLPRLGVRALRLIGSLTGATTRGMIALRAVAEVLGLDVHGTTELIYARHFDRSGFASSESLVSNRDEPISAHPPLPILASGGPARELEIEALPARPLAPGERVAMGTRDHAHELLRQIARHAGAAMPGLLAIPYCELALPSATPGAFHRLEVLLGGEYVRTYAGGPLEPGVVFPVRDPHALLHVVDELRP